MSIEEYPTSEPNVWFFMVRNLLKMWWVTCIFRQAWHIWTDPNSIKAVHGVSQQCFPFYRHTSSVKIDVIRMRSRKRNGSKNGIKRENVTWYTYIYLCSAYIYYLYLCTNHTLSFPNDYSYVDVQYIHHKVVVSSWSLKEIANGYMYRGCVWSLNCCHCNGNFVQCIESQTC